ncbi:hypothetical protein [Parasporobacterium paucivorans]|uniref:Uncharacterized protein n=1 Tax=Parasporobacterium paucivorans DSM 15970 TaxID=1122934 RepID=A0A1M6B3B0_9FIRM|nr:hypothetical protein [Parasporobacterium paucivorans]SHI43147.1 hypothetical protein SAMN02745691_00247 [Parasporobacterium paucivorans DSM 15970]
MANPENLKGKGFDSRPTSELREIQRKGCEQSAKVRREKADFRKVLNALLTAKIDSPDITPMLEAMGVKSTVESAVNAAIIKKAMEGDVKAYTAIRDTIGQTVKSEMELEELRIRNEREKYTNDVMMGKTDNSEGIKSFLNAIKPSQDDLSSLFDDDTEVSDEETAQADDV